MSQKQLSAVVSTAADRVRTYLSINEILSFRESITFALHTMAGTIQHISWKPTAQGVTEQVIISFPDKSKVLVSRFIFKAKREVSAAVSIIQ